MLFRFVSSFRNIHGSDQSDITTASVDESVCAPTRSRARASQRDSLRIVLPQSQSDPPSLHSYRPQVAPPFARRLPGLRLLAAACFTLRSPRSGAACTLPDCQPLSRFEPIWPLAITSFPHVPSQSPSNCRLYLHDFHPPSHIDYPTCLILRDQSDEKSAAALARRHRVHCTRRGLVLVRAGTSTSRLRLTRCCWHRPNWIVPNCPGMTPAYVAAFFSRPLPFAPRLGALHAHTAPRCAVWRRSKG